MDRLPARFRRVLRESTAFRFLAGAVGLAALLLYLNWHQGLVLRMELESASDQGVVAVYYDDGKGFREEATVSRPLQKGRHRYELPLPASRINSFRIDPSPHDQTTRIGALEAHSRNRLIKRFDAAAIAPASDIAFSQVEEGGRSLRFTVRQGGSDPYFVVLGSALEAQGMGASAIAAILLTAAMVMFSIAVVTGVGRGMPREPNPPSFRFGVVIALVLAMALLATTTRSVSPDEHSHLDAARYYLDNWLPPKIGEESTLGSYSAYGASYLNEPDVVYLLAAKFVASTSFIGLGDATRFRLFNVALLMLCLLLAMQRPFTMWLTLPLLCTPQAWYVFAYFNSDAMGLAATAMLAAVVMSYFERTEAGAGRIDIDWRMAIAMGTLLAVAFLCKKTFYPFIVFIGAYALWRAGFRHRLGYALGMAGLILLAVWNYSGAPSPAVAPLFATAARGLLASAVLALLAAAAWLVLGKRELGPPMPRTLATAAAIGLGLAGASFALEIAVKGWPWEQSRALTALAERIAQPDFRPSVMGTPQSYFGLALASRGVGLEEMLFSKFSWVSITSASFFGMYGYMSVIGPGWLYQAHRALALLMLALVVAALSRSQASRGALALGLSSIALAILLSILHSWTRDLQPQGRYLLVLLPIIGVMLAEAARAASKERLEMTLVRLAAGGLFVLSVASFAFVGLPGLARA